MVFLSRKSYVFIALAAIGIVFFWSSESWLQSKLVNGCLKEGSANSENVSACSRSLYYPFLRTDDKMLVKFQRARLNVELHNFESATKDLEYVYQNSSPTVELVKLYGFARYKLSEFEKSEQLFEQALEMSPDDLDTEFRLVAAIRAGTEVHNRLVKLLELHKRFPRGRYLKRELGTVLRLSGQPAQAAKIFAQLVETYPRDLVSFKSLIDICRRELSNCVRLERASSAGVDCNDAIAEYISIKLSEVGPQSIFEHKPGQVSEFDTIRTNTGSWAIFASDYTESVSRFNRDPKPGFARLIGVLEDLLTCTEADYIASEVFNDNAYYKFQRYFPSEIRENYRSFVSEFY